MTPNERIRERAVGRALEFIASNAAMLGKSKWELRILAVESDMMCPRGS
jgi:hypothetical protein